MLSGKAWWHAMSLLRFCGGATEPSCGPLRVQWDVTHRCNSKCRHCHRWRDNQLGDELTYAQGVALIKDLAGLGTINLSFAGNEPLLREDIFDLIAVASRSGLVTNLNSNGWLLDEQVARRLCDSGLDMIYISVDGATTETHETIRGVKGGFARAWRGIDCLRGARGTATRPQIMVNMVCNRKNFRELGAVGGLCLEHGVDGMLVQPIHNVKAQFEADDDLCPRPEELPELRGELRSFLTGYRDLIPLTPQYYDQFETFYRCPEKLYRYRCLAAYAAADVRPNGDVTPCPSWNESLGNFGEVGSFRAIWYSPKARELRAKISHREHPVCWMPCIVPMNLIVHSLRTGRLDQVVHPRMLSHVFRKLRKRR